MAGTAPQSPPQEATIRLLDVDPELGRSVRPERRDEARRSALATSVAVPRGRWDMEALARDRTAVYGLLLLEGLVNRTVVLDGVPGAQLLGRGDLIPPHDDPADALVPTSVTWTVLEPLTLALLDERFLFTVRRWPELVAVLFERVATQTTRRSVHRTLCQLPRVEDRLHAMLWYLAERWGRMTPQGVLLPIRLTHDLLGQLVGAKRPTVSLAIKQLEAQGALHRRDDGAWLLEQAWSPASGDAHDEELGAKAAGLVPQPASPYPRAPSPREPLPPPSFAEVRSRIDHMRHVHERARRDVASSLARSASTRARSAALRAGTRPPAAS